MSYPNVSVNCTVQLERLDPVMLTQKKKYRSREMKAYSRRKNEEYRSNKKYAFNLLREWVPGTKESTRRELIKKTANYIQKLLNPDFIPVPQEMLPRAQKIDFKDMRAYKRIKYKEYRNDEISGFNLLRKCVPGTAKLAEIKLMEKTVKYIQELRKEKKSPMECTPLTLKGLGRDSVPKITVHHYPKDSALREPQTSPSEPVKTFASTPMKKNTTMDAAVQTTSEAESESKESLLAEELPEFNTVEDLRQWLGIDDMTPSQSPEEELLGSPEEELLAEFNLELLGSPEEELLPEFNWTEDLRQYLEL